MENHAKNVQLLVSQGESETLEFKTSTAQLYRAFETICGFLNNNGGTVLIGVTDKGKIIGQEISDSTKQSIANEIKKLEPSTKVNVEYIQIDVGKHLILLQVELGPEAPYIYDGRAFIREQSTTQRMNQQLYDQRILLKKKINYSWEKSLSTKYNIDLLDKELIESSLNYAVKEKRIPGSALKQDLPKILENLELMEEGQLNNAAVALFGNKFGLHYTQCLLKVARFKGLDKHEFIDQNRYDGNIFTLLEYGMNFVQKHLPVAARIEPGKLRRVETPLIPYNAVREALINALCHKDYSDLSGSVALAIYDDRMEIYNNGGLQDGTTIEQIKIGFSRPRNPIIARVCYKFSLIENWGRGIHEMIQSCTNAGDPEPEFLSNEAEFKVIFRFPRNIAPELLYLPNTSIKLTERQNEILEIISRAEAITAHEINSQLLKPVSERTIRYELSAIKSLGLISSEGTTKKATYMIKKDMQK